MALLRSKGGGARERLGTSRIKRIVTLSHAASSCIIARARALCIHLCAHPQHGIYIGQYTAFAFQYTGSCITHGMRAALAGYRDRPRRPVSTTTSPRRRVMGAGEP